MSITINGATNTLTAASGLTIAGNTAVTGTLSATGTTTSTVAATANAFIAAASGGGDLLRIVPNAAGNGVDLLARNSADTILEPLALYGETVKLYATGGALIGTISSTGLAVTGTLSTTTLSTTSTASLAALKVFTASVQSTGVGGASPIIQVSNTGGSTSTISNRGYGLWAGLALGRSGSSVLDTLSATADTNALGYITFDGVNSSNNPTSAGYIVGTQSGAAGATYLGGTIDTYVGTNAAAATKITSISSTGLAVTGTLSASGVTSVTDTTDATSTTAASLKTAGGLGVAKKAYFGDNIVMASGKGIDFSATSDGSGTTTSEVLSDYEEGTWTGTLTAATPPTTPVTATGSYRKIGTMCHVQINFDNKDLTGAAGAMTISGLPFTSSGGNYTAAPIGLLLGLGTAVGALVVGGSTTVGAFSEAVGGANLNAVAAAGKYIRMNFSYITT